MGMRFRKSGLYALSGIVVEDGLRDKMLFERDQRDFAGHGGRVWYLAGLNGWCRDRERVRLEIIGFGRRSMFIRKLGVTETYTADPCVEPLGRHPILVD